MDLQNSLFCAILRTNMTKTIELKTKHNTFRAAMNDGELYINAVDLARYITDLAESADAAEDGTGFGRTMGNAFRALRDLLENVETIR